MLQSSNENGKLAPLFDAATIERYTKSFGRILSGKKPSEV